MILVVCLVGVPTGAGQQRSQNSIIYDNIGVTGVEVHKGKMEETQKTEGNNSPCWRNLTNLLDKRMISALA